MLFFKCDWRPMKLQRYLGGLVPLRDSHVPRAPGNTRQGCMGVCARCWQRNRFGSPRCRVSLGKHEHVRRGRLASTYTRVKFATLSAFDKSGMSKVDLTLDYQRADFLGEGNADAYCFHFTITVLATALAFHCYPPQLCLECVLPCIGRGGTDRRKAVRGWRSYSGGMYVTAHQLERDVRLVPSPSELFPAPPGRFAPREGPHMDADNESVVGAFICGRPKT